MFRKLAMVFCMVAISTAANAEASSQSINATFEQCQATLEGVISDLAVPRSEVRSIVDTSIMSVTRICVVEGSILISCSRPDEKMVITQSSKYCD